MGYRVGFQCFQDKDTATDYQMSQVVPQITANGVLYYPVKQGNKWLFQGQEVNLILPECNPKAEFQAGQEVVLMFIGLFASAFVFKFVARFIYSAFWLETETVERE